MSVIKFAVFWFQGSLTLRQTVIDPQRLFGSRCQLTESVKERLSEEAKAVAKSLRAAMSYLGMTLDQFADATSIDRDSLQQAINTGDLDYYEILNVISLVERGKTEDSKRLVARLFRDYDALVPSIFLLGGPHG